MIVKQGNQFLAMSHTGKKLGGPYKTKKDARKRLYQVEFYKNKASQPDKKRKGLFRY